MIVAEKDTKMQSCDARRKDDLDAPYIVREGNSAPAGLTFHDPLAIFTKSRLVLSRTSFLFP